MNVKRYLLASLAVFVTGMVLDQLIHNVVLKATYESLKHLWRPDMDSLMWIGPVIGVIMSCLLTYIFTKGYEGKGIMEGVRFGVVIGLFTSIPMALGTYMMIAIPCSLAVHWFVFGMIEYIVFGIVLAAVYKPAAS
jgi:hypothetical protein